jgi:phenylacetate-CoA ligase
MKIPMDSLSLGLVGGEALPGSLRTELSDSGVEVVQFYGTADLGMVAYESSAKEGMILEEKVIVEIVRPGTGEPVAEGEVGEIVVTTLSPEYPLIRFATGDLSAFMPGSSPCGRTNRRIKGWMGRADQTAKVRGMFVHPSQVASVAKRISGYSGDNVVTTISPTSPSATGSPVPGRTISTITFSSRIMPSFAEDSYATIPRSAVP